MAHLKSHRRENKVQRNGGADQTRSDKLKNQIAGDKVSRHQEQIGGETRGQMEGRAGRRTRGTESSRENNRDKQNPSL